MTNEPTIRDVLDAIQSFATNVDQRFEHVEEDIQLINQEQREMKQEVREMRSVMATKSDIVNLVSEEYLEGRLAQVR